MAPKQHAVPDPGTIENPIDIDDTIGIELDFGGVRFAAGSTTVTQTDVYDQPPPINPSLASPGERLILNFGLTGSHYILLRTECKEDVTNRTKNNRLGGYGDGDDDIIVQTYHQRCEVSECFPTKFSTVIQELLTPELSPSSSNNTDIEINNMVGSAATVHHFTVQLDKFTQSKDICFVSYSTMIQQQPVSQTSSVHSSTPRRTYRPLISGNSSRFYDNSTIPAHLSPRLMAFGDSSTYLVVFGNREDTDSEARGVVLYVGATNNRLVNRLKQLKEIHGGIHQIRLYPNGGYFIRDSFGFDWDGLGDDQSLFEALNRFREMGKVVLDVVMACDGSWLVVHPHTYSACKKVSAHLQRSLSKFYGQENCLMDRRMPGAQPSQHHPFPRQDSKPLKRRLSMTELSTTNKAQLNLSHNSRNFGSTSLLHQSHERPAIVTPKKERIEIPPLSERTTIPTQRAQENVEKDFNCNMRSVSPTNWEDPICDEMKLLGLAEDNYEAAVSFHTYSYFQRIKVTKTLSRRDSQLSSFSTSPASEPYDESLIQNHENLTLYPITNKPVDECNSYDADGYCFNEYKCPEKIDFVRLNRLVDDLKNDKFERHELLLKLRKQVNEGHNLTTTVKDRLKKLEKCRELESVASCLWSVTRKLEVDSTGCVTYGVSYEHKDASYRGRLFARGKYVQVSERKHPRTTTLQGMNGALRYPLVGAFAHDIDCENSETRLICSLASQLNLTHLIPTLFKYRNDRTTYLDLIQRLHHVNLTQAKRLASIILSGGTYRTWLNLMDRHKADSRSLDGNNLMEYVVCLQDEIQQFAEEILTHHPRFRWTDIDRKKMLASGKRGRSDAMSMFPKIVQQCENDVLSLIHRSFIESGWIVRAKIFDGVIVENSSPLKNSVTRVKTPRPLPDALVAAEQFCRTFEWDVTLREKSLRGRHDETIPTIEEARDVLQIEREEEYWRSQHS